MTMFDLGGSTIVEIGGRAEEVESQLHTEFVANTSDTPANYADRLIHAIQEGIGGLAVSQLDEEMLKRPVELVTVDA